MAPAPAPTSDPEPLPDLAVLRGLAANAELARLCKALGHPVRVRIVRRLADRTTCVYGEFADEIPLAQSTISQHLSVLKEAGLVRGEVEGPRICYCLDREALRRLRTLLSAV